MHDDKNRLADGSVISKTSETLMVRKKIFHINKLTMVNSGEVNHHLDVHTGSFREDRDSHLKETMIDYCWSLRRTKEQNGAPARRQQIIFKGRTFFFRTLSDSAILTIHRNCDNWSNSEVVLPTREDLITYLASEGFASPWMVFNHGMLFPFTLRVPDEAISHSSVLAYQLKELIANTKRTREDVTLVVEELKKHVTGQFRYIFVDAPSQVFCRQYIGASQDIINRVFFEAGIVILGKLSEDSNRDKGSYEGRQGRLYYDAKLCLDRIAPFTDHVQHGWDVFLDGGYK